MGQAFKCFVSWVGFAPPELESMGGLRFDFRREALILINSPGWLMSDFRVCVRRSTCYARYALVYRKAAMLLQYSIY